MQVRPLSINYKPMLTISQAKSFVSKNKYVLILALIIVWGFFLRIYNLGFQSYWIDEGYTLNAVLATIEKGYPILESGFHYSRAILNTYIIAGFVKVFGFNPWITRLPSVIFGTLFIYLIYRFAKRFFNQKIALITALLVALSYWEIAWSRQARMYIQLQFFYFLSLYFFWKFINKYDIKNFIYTSVFTLLAILSHLFGLLLLPVYLITFLTPTLGKWVLKKSFGKKESILAKYLNPIKQLKQKNPVCFYSLIIISLTFLFYILYLGIPILKDVLHKSINVSGAYQSFLIQKMPIILFGALLGLFWAAIREKNNLKIFFLFLSYTAPYLIIVNFTELVHFRYIFFILPILYIFVAYLIFHLAYTIKNLYYHLTSRIHIPFVNISAVFVYHLVFIGLLVLVLTKSFIFLPRADYVLEPLTPQPDFKGAYKFIKKDWSLDKVIISPFSQMDKIYLGKADYWLPISLTGGKQDFEFLITQDKKHEVYTNAPIIQNLTQFKDITKNNKGYIIIDEMSAVRLHKELLDYIKENLGLVWNHDQGLWRRIWVYSF